MTKGELSLFPELIDYYSNTQNKNNRVILPFRWAGGKYYALKLLRPFWQIEHDEYREPFLGGGSVFWAKPKVKYNWINDIDEDLIQTLTYISDFQKRDKLLDLFKDEFEATKEKYREVKNIASTSDLERAYRYYYLNRTSFSGKMRNPTWGYKPVRSLPPYRWKERIIPCSEKLQGVKVTSEDFEKIILSEPEGEKILMFLDPPYFIPKQTSHYAKSFQKDDHYRLAGLLKKTTYSFFLTYDDCPEIRSIYKWANINELNFIYRLDNSNNNENKRRFGNELVITNY